MKLSFSFLTLFFVCLQAGAAESLSTKTIEEAMSWLQNLNPTQGVHTEISKFEGLDQDYTNKLPHIVKEKIQTEARSVLASIANSGKCEDKIIVSFPKSVTDLGKNNSAVSNFESGFAKIQLFKCMPGVTPDKVLKVWLSSDYQSKVFPEIKKYVDKGNEICKQNYTFPIGRSSFCFSNAVFESEGNAFVHSFVHKNDDNVDIINYFQEFFVSAVKVPQGTAFYGVLYARGMNLSSFIEKMARKQIQSANETALNDLYQRAQNP